MCCLFLAEIMGFYCKEGVRVAIFEGWDINTVGSVCSIGGFLLGVLSGIVGTRIVSNRSVNQSMDNSPGANQIGKIGK